MTIENGPIVIIGQNGQVSRSLWDVLRTGNGNVIRIGRPALDLTTPQAIQDTIAALRPSIVINAAAYTAVDKAEDEPEIAEAINGTGAAIVAEAAARVDAPIVHFSTDYVFDGRKETPYVETDDPAPLGVYGRTKLAGERRVAAANPKHVILRTSWVFSPFGNNFVKTILRLAGERSELSVVDDQHGNPTYAPDLAQAVAALLPIIVRPAADSKCFGIFHATNRGSTTWFQFARRIVEMTTMQRKGCPIMRPIGTRDYPTKARRPANCILATDKLSTTHGIELPPWEPALANCIERLANTTPNPTN